MGRKIEQVQTKNIQFEKLHLQDALPQFRQLKKKIPYFY